MKKVLKIGLILSLAINSLFADTKEEQKEKEKKEETLVKVREEKGKIETPQEVLERLNKAGNKKSKTDDILNGNTGFKF
ncbi:hypothetical protein N3114_12650 (plasmid) [Aliarcobacter butzleri]|uniref:hypothetical protein n=1 Tax=Aliarcobacter butzleri TaxID=28197 RepID=UPI0021B2181E|nr:hypothetical protein [Aliarcobacter butzleri]UXC30739.1 hypothetical protein N3114_12650 [Aliarcobacter butzleri]